jgi:hypothetical protein
MAKRTRKPKPILEWQTIPVMLIMGGEPINGGTVSAEDKQGPSGAWDLHDVDLRTWKDNPPARLPVLGNRYWDGDKWVDDRRQAKHFHCRDSPDPEEVVESIRRAGYRAAVVVVPVPTAEMTPVQLRKFLDGIQNDTSNDRLLMAIGSFWKEPVTQQEKEEWVQWVEAHAAPKST